MTPLEAYENKVKEQSIRRDEQQIAIMQALTSVHKGLCDEYIKRQKILSVLRKNKTVPGLYLCGTVGIGKTMMMDCFYNTISFDEKLRMHFHPFMRMVHRELKHHQGKKNPLDLIADHIAKKYMLICFDEFFVNDIADAMLLARLLDALFSRGVTIVATSNVMPDNLYERGLQRESFLPAIDLIKKYMHVKHVPVTEDYRLRHLNHAGVFFIPNDQEAKQEMERSFIMLSNDGEHSAADITICQRQIPIVRAATDVIWFDFDKICSPPRSQNDYLEIAEKYKTVFISDITMMRFEDNNRINLFIKLIDVFYDTHTRLVISAEDEVENLYMHGRMVFEYRRACSRLHEMQSSHYFFRR